MRIRMNLEDMGEEQRQGIYYISALTKPEILALVENDTIQLSLFAKDLVEVESQGVRYVLSTNPLLEEQKHQLRDSLKQRFEQETMFIKQGWKKRKEQNEKNIEKLKQGHKTHFTSSFLKFSGATVIFIAFCSNEYNNYFI